MSWLELPNGLRRAIMSTETTLTTTTRVTVTVDYGGEQYSAVVTRRPDAAGVG